MLLYPDQSVEQPDNPTTCFAAPVSQGEIHSLIACSVPQRDGLNYMPFVIITDDSAFYVMDRGQDGYRRTAILLRENEEDADTCLESAAWIRLKHEFNGMIYILSPDTTPHTEQQKWITHGRALGAPPEYVCMVDLPSED